MVTCDSYCHDSTVDDVGDILLLSEPSMLSVRSHVFFLVLVPLTLSGACHNYNLTLLFTCYVTILYVVKSQVSISFIDNKGSVFCIPLSLIVADDMKN